MTLLEVVDRPSLWVPYYNVVVKNYGLNDSGLQVPFGDPNDEDSPTAPTKVTTRGAEQVDFTYTNSGRHLWATALTYEGPGQIPVLNFDQSTDWAESPDAPFWNDTAGSNEPSYCWALWVFVVAGASIHSLFTKTPSLGTAGTDWGLLLGSTEVFTGRIYDDSAAAFIGSLSSVLSGGWHYLVATKHDDAATSASVISYVDGEADRSDDADGTYVTQQDGTVVVRIGAESDGGFPNGQSIAGAGHGPIFKNVGAGAVWTPDEIRSVFQRQRVGLGV